MWYFIHRQWNKQVVELGHGGCSINDELGNDVPTQTPASVIKVLWIMY